MTAPEAKERGEGAGASPVHWLLPRRDPRRAEVGTWRGVLWTVVVAADLFLMSNPLVFVAGMDRALTLAAMVTGAALVVTFPWVRAPRISGTVLLFLGWLLLSMTWSIQPSYTAAAWAQTAAIAAVAAAVCANAVGRVLAAGFMLGGVVVSVASVYAFHERLDGAYHWPLEGGLVMAGIGTNQNILAYTLTLALCGACVAVPHGAMARVGWLAATVIIGYGLVESHSATGYVTGAAVVVTAIALAGYGPASRRLLRTRTQWIVTTMGVTVLAIGAFVSLQRILGQQLLTFSDRTVLWSAAIAVAQDRPLRGFGYGAVWQHPWKPPLLNIVIGDIWERSGTALSHGHNSVVDLVVEVGLVGVLLMAGVMLMAGFRALLQLRLSVRNSVDDSIMAKFTVLCLVNLAVFGITEPMATIPLGWWALVMLTEPRRPRRPAGYLPRKLQTQ